MRDQLYSAHNFRKIFDAENRRGLDLASRFSTLSDIKRARKKAQAQLAKLKKLKESKTSKNLYPNSFPTRVEIMKKKHEALKQDIENLVEGKMEELSEKVSKPEFKIEVECLQGPKGKPVFRIQQSPEAFLVMKQLQKNVFHLYKVKQANRHDLCNRIRDTIGKGFPLEVVRTDISSFYESVDREKLLTKIEKDGLLSPKSKKFIRQVFQSYFELTGQQKGIPRGIGVSAYLAEVFVRPIDRAILRLPGSVLYCRYVDDIFAVFARPPSGDFNSSYRFEIECIVRHHGLRLNEEKTSNFNFGRSESSYSFDYLGYTYVAKLNSLSILPSLGKVNKIKERLEVIFSEYKRTSRTESRRAFHDLIARVQFLTGNTRLWHSKFFARTGIFYNSPIATDLSRFEDLDKILKNKIKSITSKALRRELKRYSFLSGFTDRRFHRFSYSRIRSIVEVWKYV